MMRIYKFTLKPGAHDYEMSDGAELLHVANQHENVCLWAMVDNTKPISKRRIGVVPTGIDFDAENSKYVGTVSLQGGNLIFHVFEKLP